MDIWKGWQTGRSAASGENGPGRKPEEGSKVDRCIFLTAALGFCGLMLDVAGKSLGSATLVSAGTYLMVPGFAALAVMGAASIVIVVVRFGARKTPDRKLRP